MVKKKNKTKKILNKKQNRPMQENSETHKRKQWSHLELQRLKYLYEIEGKSLSELKFLFPKRTINSIGIKIDRLKLKHSSIQKINIWSRIRIGNKNPRYGKSPLTKGHTKHTLECLMKGSKKLSNTIKLKIDRGEWGHKGNLNGMYGKNPWNKGLNKNINEKIKLGGLKCSNTKKKLYQSLPECEKKKIKDNMAYIGSKCNKKNTSIELKIGSFLNSINETFYSNYIKDGFSFDFYLPTYNVVIECQGDYWHMNPRKYNTPDNIQTKNINRDNKKLKYLNDNKYKYLFLWEYDIKNNFDDIKEKLKKILL